MKEQEGKMQKAGLESVHRPMLIKCSSGDWGQQPKPRRKLGVPERKTLRHCVDASHSSNCVTSFEGSSNGQPLKKRATLKPFQPSTFMPRADAVDNASCDNSPQYRLPPILNLHSDQILHRSVHSLVPTTVEPSPNKQAARSVTFKLLGAKYRRKVQQLHAIPEPKVERIYQTLIEGLSELTAALPEGEDFLELMVGLVDGLQEYSRLQQKDQQTKLAQHDSKEPETTLPAATDNTVDTATVTVAFNAIEVPNAGVRERLRATKKMLSTSAEFTNENIGLSPSKLQSRERPVIPKLRLDRVRKAQFINN